MERISILRYCALETARWEQRHSELQELVLVHAVDHDFKAVGERFEVAIDPVDALQNRSGIRRGSRVHLLQFMQGEFEIQLGNLVVDDEDGLIGNGVMGCCNSTTYRG